MVTWRDCGGGYRVIGVYRRSYLCFYSIYIIYVNPSSQWDTQVMDCCCYYIYIYISWYMLTDRFVVSNERLESGCWSLILVSEKLTIRFSWANSWIGKWKWKLYACFKCTADKRVYYLESSIESTHTCPRLYATFTCYMCFATTATRL